MKQFYFICFIINTVYGGFCDENYVPSASGVSEIYVQALQSFNEDICSGNFIAAAVSLYSAVCYGYQVDSAPIAKAFSEAAEHNVYHTSNALALAIKGKNALEAHKIFETIGQSYENIKNIDAYYAGVTMGYGKAIGYSYLDVNTAFYGILDRELNETLVIEILEQAMLVTCGSVKTLFADMWTIYFKNLPEDVMVMSKNFEVIQGIKKKVQDAHQCL